MGAHCYLIDHPDGLVLIDPGMSLGLNRVARALHASGRSPRAVSHLLLTHYDADHAQVAAAWQRRTGAGVWLGAADAAILTGAAAIPTGFRRLMGGVLGLPELPGGLHLVEGRDEILPGIEAVPTPGHTPGHLCFYDEEKQIMLTGDHVLPRITPNIGVSPQQTPNPLQEFMDSLSQVGAYEAKDVYPGHEYRFSGLTERTADLREHHEHRLAELVAAMEATPNSTTYELAEALTWSRPWSELQTWARRSASGETASHIFMLLFQGKVLHDGGVPQRWRLR